MGFFTGIARVFEEVLANLWGLCREVMKNFTEFIEMTFGDVLQLVASIMASSGELLHNSS